MGLMKLNGLKIELYTNQGLQGFSCSFKSGLNIIRGNNSSGKSTLVSAIFYALGMEEILGGKGIKFLPYALKDYIELKGDKARIFESFVYLEIENANSEVITIRRSITSSERSDKLVEIIHGRLSSHEGVIIQPTYIHDPGSAKNTKAGYFAFLEGFIGLRLPTVLGTSGGDVKLYLQTIFSAMLIEQKRGWTDYIANLPFFSIASPKKRVIEFLIDLEVFRNEKKRAKISSELQEIQKAWAEKVYEVDLVCNQGFLVYSGIPKKVSAEFKTDLVSLFKVVDNEKVLLAKYVADLSEKISNLQAKRNVEGIPEDLLKKFNEEQNRFEEYVELQSAISSDIRINKAKLSGYKDSLQNIDDDLGKNKIAKKLKGLGAEFELDVASDLCPSCHQRIDDSLIMAETGFQPMSLDQNIAFLESQKKMVVRYELGISELINKQQIQLKSVEENISDQKLVVLSLKRDIRGLGSVSEADVRVKLNLEDKLSKICSSEERFRTVIAELEEIQLKYIDCKQRLSSLPKTTLSKGDYEKLTDIQSHFRKLAHSFGYRSAPVEDIEINSETYFPYLSGLELREINVDVDVDIRTDIKSDSSASDYVRLIWAYLLSIQLVSSKLNGNHPGLILFDEPAQHSMGVSSVNRLLQALNDHNLGQSIVAASFDESDEMFDKCTNSVDYHLVELGSKLFE